MKLKRILLYIIIIELLALSTSCSKLDDNRYPTFYVELTQELFYRYAHGVGDAVGLSICVADQDMDYLRKPFVLSVEQLAGGQVNLIEETTWESIEYTILDELNSTGTTLETVNKFHDGMIDSNYAAFVSFPVICNEKLNAFRLKLHFGESSETFYTNPYTLVRIPYAENMYLYWLMPGEFMDKD